jgi:hypothetical protein
MFSIVEFKLGYADFKNHQPKQPEDFKDKPEFRIVSFFKFFELLGKFGAGVKSLALQNKGPQNLYIHCDAMIAAKHASEHGNTLLGECKGKIAKLHAPGQGAELAP